MNPNDHDAVTAADATIPSSTAASTHHALLDGTAPEERRQLLLQHLPACQPQEGSPPNTFTDSELQELQAALPGQLNLRPRNANAPATSASSGDTKDDREKKSSSEHHHSAATTVDSNKLDITAPWPQEAPPVVHVPADDAPGTTALAAPSENPQEQVLVQQQPKQQQQLDSWFGAPQRSLPSQRTRAQAAAAFRARVRAGEWTRPTNGVCPGNLQCNLVVLPQGPTAFDFLLFCQRNPKACPLLEVCSCSGGPDDLAKSYTPSLLAPTADLRTDVPKYAIYRNGQLERECTDVTDVWPAQGAVAFLIGCSFSYDGALLDAGIPLKSAEQHKNVPMYKTNLPCRPAGSLHGRLVVSMKPIPALAVSQHVEITSKYTHAHGGPVCVGCPQVLGIDRLDEPDWGDPIDMDAAKEVPVFHACGVTPQAVLQESRVEFAITHAAGHMFVTDLPADMGV